MIIKLQAPRTANGYPLQLKIDIEKYGVITNGANSLYQYFLTVDGYIIDSDGDIRYIPQGKS